MIRKMMPFLLALAVAVSASSSRAFADWREDMGRLRIGLASDRAGGDTISRYEPFRLAIEEKLGLTVELVPFSSLESLARAHAGGRVEYAIYPATSYAAVWINCECIEPLAVAAAGDGTTAAHSVLVTRNDSQVRGPVDLEGRKVWLLAEKGILTRYYALHAMQAEFPDLEQKSIEWLTADNPRAAIRRFVAGEGDALIGWSSLTGDMAQGYSRGTPRLIAEQVGDFSGFRTVWQSQPLPHHVHAIRKKVDGEARQLLREALTTMETQDPVAYDTIEPVFEGGLQAVPHSAFQSAIRFVRSLLPEGEAGRTPDERISGEADGNSDSASSQLQRDGGSENLPTAPADGMAPVSQ